MKRRKAPTRRTPPTTPRTAPRFVLASVLTAILAVYAGLWYVTRPRPDTGLVAKVWHCSCSDGGTCTARNLGQRSESLFRQGVVRDVPNATNPSSDGSRQFIRDDAGDVIVLACARGMLILDTINNAPSVGI